MKLVRKLKEFIKNKYTSFIMRLIYFLVSCLKVMMLHVIKVKDLSMNPYKELNLLFDKTSDLKRCFGVDNWVPTPGHGSARKYVQATRNFQEYDIENKKTAQFPRANVECPPSYPCPTTLPLNPNILNNSLTGTPDKQSLNNALDILKKYANSDKYNTDVSSEKVIITEPIEVVEPVDTKEIDLKLKTSKAKSLCQDMILTGLLNSDKASVDAQMEEIMKFNDEALNALIRLVAKHPIKHISVKKTPIVKKKPKGK